MIRFLRPAWPEGSSHLAMFSVLKSPLNEATLQLETCPNRSLRTHDPKREHDNPLLPEWSPHGEPERGPLSQSRTRDNRYCVVSEHPSAMANSYCWPQMASALQRHSIAGQPSTDDNPDPKQRPAKLIHAAQGLFHDLHHHWGR